MELPLNNVYPSIEELTPETIKAIVPALLIEEIEFRYNELGDKYITVYKHPDGRQINACMFNSSVQDCREEVVDAVFNVLVWALKLHMHGDIQASTNAGLILKDLIHVYGLLIASKEKDAIPTT